MGSLNRKVAKDTVTIYRWGQYILVDPVIGGTERFLFARSLCFGGVPEDAEIPLRVPQPFLWEQTYRIDIPCLQGFAGQEPLLVELLERNGFRITLGRNRPSPLPSPDLKTLSVFASLDGGLDAGMLQFVRLHDRGLIRYASSEKVSPSRLMAEIIQAWPSKKVIVAVTRINDARHVARQLRNYGIELTVRTSRHGTRRAGRVVVGTYAFLGDAGLEQCDLYLALNPAEIFSGKEVNTWGLECIKRLHRARLYGLLADDATPA